MFGKRLKQNNLALLLLASIFMNGFETGGYQAALNSISETYELDSGAAGVMASVELFATMIAPILLGSIADRAGKKIMLVLLTAIRAISGILIMIATASIPFAVGIFIMGFTTSIIQYVAIAQMQDAYPKTSHQRMGLITAMYATGALIAPLIVGFCIEKFGGWKFFFASDVVLSTILTVLLFRTSFAVREIVEKREKDNLENLSNEEKSKKTGIYVYGVFLLCMIMFIYVGVESGVGFFLTSFMQKSMNSAKGYIAVSLLWMAMIPSRILCGIFVRFRSKMIIFTCIGAALFLFLLAGMRQVIPTFIVVFILGMFCGAVYPNVLTYADDFANGKTATVISAITVATGIGGTLVSAVFGYMEQAVGFSWSFIILGILMLIDAVFASLVVKKSTIH